MSELSLSEIGHRIIVLEKDVEELYSKVNGVDKSLVATTTTLNNLLTLVGELKAAVESLKARPTAWWDKLIFAVIGAVATALITYFIK